MVRISQKNKFTTFSEYVATWCIGVSFWGLIPFAALRSDSRVIPTHEWTPWYPQVCKRFFPEYAVGDNR